MIRELIRSWRTPASKAARELGYLYESIAMQERYRRRQKSWQSHIDKCYEITIREALPYSDKGQGTLLILGSGPLNEVPLTELCEIFGTIHLADIVHPREVRKKWGKHHKVELHDIDLTGVAEKMRLYSSGKLPSPVPPELPHADFILSANCLSQLALKPRERAEGHASAQELDDFCEALSASHIEQIKKSGVPHLIIADFETDILDEDGQVLERTQPFVELNSLHLIEQWSWSVAPKGEYHRKNSVRMTVGAFRTLK